MFPIQQMREYVYKTLGTTESPPKLMYIYSTIPNSIYGHTNNNKVTNVFNPTNERMFL